jgi:hypothetical protein
MSNLIICTVHEMSLADQIQKVRMDCNSIGRFRHRQYNIKMYGEETGHKGVNFTPLAQERIQ